MNEPIASPEQPRHEITVWRARPFIIGVLSFMVFMTVLFIVIGGLTASWSFHTWPLRHAPEGPQASAAWNRSVPQLQASPPMDLAALQKEEFAKLHSLHWTDETHSYAVIPIDEAMTLLAQSAANHQSLLPPPKPATPLLLQRAQSIPAAPSSP